MNLFYIAHQEILILLNKHKVRYLLVGGYAVMLKGYKRVTGDLDLWIQPTNANRDLLCDALLDDGYDVGEIEIIKNEDFSQAFVFSIGNEPYKVDFITKVNLLEFESSYKQCVWGEYDGILIPVLHLNDLILSKINTGRAKDAADIEELQRIEKITKN